MNFTERTESGLNPVFFWNMTALAGFLTALQGVMLRFSDNYLVTTIPVYLQIAWAIIALMLLPTFKSAGPLWVNLAYVILTAVAVPVMLFDDNLLPAYLLCSGTFIVYLAIKQARQVPGTFNSVPTAGFKGPVFAGKNVAEWLLRLIFAVYLAGLFSDIVSIRSDLMPEDFSSNFFSINAPVASLLVCCCLIAGIYLRQNLVIIIGALVNFVYLALFIGQFTSPVEGAEFFSIISTGGWTGLAASIAFVLVAATDWYCNRRPVVQTQLTSLPTLASDDRSSIAAFPLRPVEMLVFPVIAIILFFILVPHTPDREQASNAVGHGDIETLKSLVKRTPALIDNELFTQAIGGRNAEILTFLLDSGIRPETLKLDSFDVAQLLQSHDLALAKRLADNGFDFTRTGYLRHIVSSNSSQYAVRNGSINNQARGPAAMKFLLRQRTDCGKLLDEFYLPLDESELNSSYRFSNPMAIAVEKGSSEIANFLFEEGFRIDDEVLAASIATSNHAANPFKDLLRLTGNSQLKRPLAFELLAPDLDVERADRFLDMGISLVATDSEGNNLFHHLAAENRVSNAAEHVLKKALLAGCNINAENLAGKKPLWIAVEKNRVQSFALMLKLGADKTIRSRDGLSIKEFCEKHGYITLLIHLE